MASSRQWCYFRKCRRKSRKSLIVSLAGTDCQKWRIWSCFSIYKGGMKESLCWMATAIIGVVPHAVTKDDVYMGYLIPKDAGVLNNVYTILHDPKRFPDPGRFGPDRYKKDRQSLYGTASNPEASKRDTFRFGAGRSICAVMHVAERSFFLGISRMLWVFDIRPAVEQTTGQVPMPDLEKLTQGFVCLTEPYHATITARSPEQAVRIRYQWEQAQKSLDSRTQQWIEVPNGRWPPSL